MSSVDASKEALKRLFPRLKPEDAGLLNKRHRTRLYRRMRHSNLCYSLVGDSYDTGFLIAILRALQKIGDEGTLKHVQRLAESSKVPHIREAAQDCLLTLRERIGGRPVHD